MSLTGQGICSYQGFDFADSPFLSTSVRAKEIPTDSKLTTKAVAYEVSVNGFIHAPADDTTDDQLESLRQLLLKRGGPFILERKGFASLQVNTPDGVTDLEVNGPVPDMLEWVPIGNDQTAKIAYKLTVTVPECVGATRLHGIMMLDYDVNWDAPRHGFTTRKTAIVLQVAQHVSAAGRLLDSADAYLESIIPAKIPGFDRDVSRQLSQDKAKLTLTVTDEESGPLIKPDGVASSGLRHTVGTSLKLGFVQYQHTLAGTMQMSDGFPPSLA